jgi:FkbM family methyltransferase
MGFRLSAALLPSLAFHVARKPCTVFVVAFVGALLGTIIGQMYILQQDVHSYSLLATADEGSSPTSSSSISSSSSPECPQWTISAGTQKQVQHDYCIRHFTGEAPAADLVKTKLQGPDQDRMDFVVYGGKDIVSGAIQSNGHWEFHLSTALVTALTTVAEERGLPPSQVHLLDIGGNVGAHTVYAQAAGFPVVAFEPLPQNEPIIQTNLCFNDPDEERVTLFTVGLGSEPTKCKQYSAPNYNRGNGVVSCNGSVPQHADGHLTYRGQMEVVRLDDVLLPCNGGTELPPGMVFGAMKMDVEGFEPHVLEGGRAFLTKAQIPFIVFEIGRMSEEQRKGVLKFFYGLGYKASTQGVFKGLGRPKDLPGVEDVHLVLQEDGVKSTKKV